MSYRTSVQTLTIAQSEVLSTAAKIDGWREVALGFLTAVEDSDYTFEVGASANSADMVPLYHYDLTGGNVASVTTIATAGSMSTPLPDHNMPYTHMRVRSADPQSAARSILLYGRSHSN